MSVNHVVWQNLYSHFCAQSEVDCRQQDTPALLYIHQCLFSAFSPKVLCFVRRRGWGWEWAEDGRGMVMYYSCKSDSHQTIAFKISKGKDLCIYSVFSVEPLPLLGQESQESSPPVTSRSVPFRPHVKKPTPLIYLLRGVTPSTFPASPDT